MQRSEDNTCILFTIRIVYYVKIIMIDNAPRLKESFWPSVDFENSREGENRVRVLLFSHGIRDAFNVIKFLRYLLEKRISSGPAFRDHYLKVFFIFLKGRIITTES